MSILFGDDKLPSADDLIADAERRARECKTPDGRYSYAGECGALRAYVQLLCGRLQRFWDGDPANGQEHFDVDIDGVKLTAVVEHYDDIWSVVGILHRGDDVTELLAGKTAEIDAEVGRQIEARNERNRADMLEAA